eukprot:CAMPEP_0172330032 /NCGR_PEP_ID=MMETSP1058-20130122/61190_1 /TAXON_ID=83371 /ORGANISM="Detonula confervacea, Strain CCMP 353" /LENGTH=362 /DNA_ID=CAMNT_0013047231 /DNA_START=1933 /DNA_END=3021 /DNA_ORIENTATION=-
MTSAGLLLFLVAGTGTGGADAFFFPNHNQCQRRTLLLRGIDNICVHGGSQATKLDMGKGFNSANNKQANLAKKMALAKNQNRNNNNNDTNVDEGVVEQQTLSQTEEERKLEEDQARFAQMLGESMVSNPNPREESGDFYKNQRLAIRGNQESQSQAAPAMMVGRVKAVKTRKANDAKRRKKKRAEELEEETNVDKPLHEGDIAKRRDFEPLIDCDSGIPLGPIEAARLVPWVPPFVKDCMIILSDPRAQSNDLRRTIQYLTSNLSSTSGILLEQVIAISSDDISETNSWKNRVDVDTSIRIFSDVNWEWMRRYSAVVSDGRWSLSIIVIDTDGVIREVIRDVEPSNASQLVAKSVEAIKQTG